mgnify:CR=1 FL=1
MFEPDFTFFDSSSSTVEQSQNYDQFPVMNDNKSMMLVPYSRQAQSSSPTSDSMNRDMRKQQFILSYCRKQENKMSMCVCVCI